MSSAREAPPPGGDTSDAEAMPESVSSRPARRRSRTAGPQSDQEESQDELADLVAHLPFHPIGPPTPPMGEEDQRGAQEPRRGRSSRRSRRDGTDALEVRSVSPDSDRGGDLEPPVRLDGESEDEESTRKPVSHRSPQAMGSPSRSAPPQPPQSGLKLETLREELDETAAVEGKRVRPGAVRLTPPGSHKAEASEGVATGTPLGSTMVPASLDQSTNPMEDSAWTETPAGGIGSPTLPLLSSYQFGAPREDGRKVPSIPSLDDAAETASREGYSSRASTSVHTEATAEERRRSLMGIAVGNLVEALVADFAPQAHAHLEERISDLAPEYRATSAGEALKAELLEETASTPMGSTMMPPSSLDQSAGALPLGTTDSTWQPGSLGDTQAMLQAATAPGAFGLGALREDEVGPRMPGPVSADVAESTLRELLSSRAFDSVRSATAEERHGAVAGLAMGGLVESLVTDLAEVLPPGSATSSQPWTPAMDSVRTEASLEERIVNSLDLGPDYGELVVPEQPRIAEEPRPSSSVAFSSVDTEASLEERIVRGIDLFDNKPIPELSGDEEREAEAESPKPHEAEEELLEEPPQLPEEPKELTSEASVDEAKATAPPDEVAITASEEAAKEEGELEVEVPPPLPPRSRPPSSAAFSSVGTEASLEERIVAAIDLLGTEPADPEVEEVEEEPPAPPVKKVPSEANEQQRAKKAIIFDLPDGSRPAWQEAFRTQDEAKDILTHEPGTDGEPEDEAAKSNRPTLRRGPTYAENLDEHLAPAWDDPDDDHHEATKSWAQWAADLAETPEPRVVPKEVAAPEEPGGHFPVWDSELGRSSTEPGAEPGTRAEEEAKEEQRGDSLSPKLEQPLVDLYKDLQQQKLLLEQEDIDDEPLKPWKGHEKIARRKKQRRPTRRSRLSEIAGDRKTAEDLLRLYASWTSDDFQRLKAPKLPRQAPPPVPAPPEPLQRRAADALEERRAEEDAKRVARLVYHRCVSPPPVYQPFRRSAMEQDIKEVSGDKPFFDPEMKEARLQYRRATYTCPQPGSQTLTTMRKEAAEKGKMACTLPGIKMPRGLAGGQTQSAPALPRVVITSSSHNALRGSPTREMQEAEYASRLMKKYRMPGGIQMLVMLKEGRSPAILCPPI